MALVLFGNSGFRNLVSEWREKSRLQRTLIRLRTEHETLAREWNRIQQDPAYVEYVIRKNLGYVKKGEYEYRFIKPEKEKSR
jgi:cell division protein FtsB